MLRGLLFVESKGCVQVEGNGEDFRGNRKDVSMCLVLLANSIFKWG